MLDLVQVTAQYSNAVLIAILPHVSDFAAKIGAPAHLPVTASQVLEFKCDPRKDHVGGEVILTNHLEFAYLYGRVAMYRSPKSYFSLQDPERIPAFYGKVAVDETMALRSVRETIHKLGYTDAMLHADTAPVVTRPEKIGTDSVARYRFRWIDPRWRGKTNSGFVPAVLDVEVNASNGHVEMMTISSIESRRPNPTVGVEPPPLSSQPETKAKESRPPAVWANKEYALEALKAILPSISDFIQKAALPIKTPVTTNDVDMARYTCVIENGSPVIQLYLKNRDRFNFLHGHFAAYYAHDAFMKFPDRGRVEDFIGLITVSTNEAVSLAESTLRRLGYAGTNMDIVTEVPVPAGTSSFTRLFIHVRYPGSDIEMATLEMDLSRTGIKSLYFDDRSVWREPPVIDAPSVTQTNRPSY